MIQLIHRDIKVTYYIFHVFKKVEKNISLLNKDMENIKRCKSNL